MLAALARYAANRAVHGVADGFVRRASWGGAAAVFVIIGVVALAIVGFWLLQRRFGSEIAGLIIAAGCFALAIGAAVMPAIIERSEAAVTTDGASEVVTAVADEAKEAVDYVGPVRLVASAFMVGVGAGRRLKQR